MEIHIKAIGCIQEDERVRDATRGTSKNSSTERETIVSEIVFRKRGEVVWMRGIDNGSTYCIETENAFKSMDGSFRGDSISGASDEIHGYETMEKQARNT